MWSRRGPPPPRLTAGTSTVRVVSAFRRFGKPWAIATNSIPNLLRTYDEISSHGFGVSYGSRHLNVRSSFSFCVLRGKQRDKFVCTRLRNEWHPPRLYATRDSLDASETAFKRSEIERRYPPFTSRTVSTREFVYFTKTTFFFF